MTFVSATTQRHILHSFPTFPLLMLTESLGHTSAISVLLAVVFVAVSSAMAVYAMWQGETQQLRLVPDFDNGVSYFELSTTIPVLATGLACHVTIHPVRAELGKPSDMNSAIRISLLLSITIYFAVGFTGYLLFGDSIMADMLVNFDQNCDSPIGLIVNDLVRFRYAVHLMLVFPVINFSLRTNVDELLFPKKLLLATDTLRFVSLTCSLLAVINMAAIAIPNIWFFFQFVGSTTIACLAFAFPGAIVLRYPPLNYSRDRIMAVLVIILAIVTSSIAISTSVCSSVLQKSEITKLLVHLEFMLSASPEFKLPSSNCAFSYLLSSYGHNAHLFILK
ncbi:hypothetical protein RJ640_026288 [Escallonia rubra]|uniref:Amino acid transporter transmembrane domain-containing protein n=1 Tax=Escallonia rubra TaxID=112253 RepID=A0AA88RHI1_9ASTE|nr:hypothetical protein RJ640_026288 [Escallonia rubra]